MDDLQHQLHRARVSASRSFNPDAEAKPKWLTTMPEVYGLTDQFSLLLEQIPQIVAANNSEVTKTFFRQLISELTKIYAYRLQIVELSDTLNEADKAAEITRLVTESRTYLTELASLLEYGRKPA